SPEISALSLHDALPIWRVARARGCRRRLDDGGAERAGRMGPGAVGAGDATAVVARRRAGGGGRAAAAARHAGAACCARAARRVRSEEHTSELQSRENLV